MAPSHSFRQVLLLCAACGLVGNLTGLHTARAQDAQVNLQLAQLNIPTDAPSRNATSPRQTPGSAIPPAVSQGTTEDILVKAKRRLVKEKNSPSAVTELGQKQIDATGVGGSVATLLRQAPSVYVYQQGIGANEPVLSIRGVRGLEVAQTLDDIPMQDLLNGGTGAYLQNNLGGRFDLNQISGVSIYPGVAYPDKNTFGTIGGTIAYQSKRPTNDFYFDVSGEVGSFETYTEGFELNSGKMDGPLGTGDNAPSLLLNYKNEQTAGFIDYTGARYNNMEFAFDKPFDDGLSKFQATVIYNVANGYIQSEPTPLPYLQKNGLFSNYNPSLLSQFQTNNNLTVLLKADKYVNDNLNVGLSAFYLSSDTTLNSYSNINFFTPVGAPNPLVVSGAAPFAQTPAGFGLPAAFYGPGGDLFNPNGGLPFFNPAGTEVAGTAGCPGYIVAAAGGIGSSACGITGAFTATHNDTYGVQPRLTYFAPSFYGIENTIKVGGLIAKETQPTAQEYLGEGPNIPQDAAHNVGGLFTAHIDGGSQRTIYQAYAQDKIDFLGNTLHVTPGLTIEGTSSSNSYAISSEENYGPFSANKWDREYLPFFNVSYDLDKILPALAGTSIYGSTGQSALFAPATDIAPNLAQGVPYASIVHLYEGGVKYDTSRLALSADYFYQKVDRDFGFSQGQVGPLAGESIYTNNGQREFKGFEASGTWQVTDNIQLFGNVSHTLAKYLDSYLASVTVFQDQFGLAQKGTNNTGIPDWLSNFGVDYETKSLFRDGDSFSARFSGTYTGQQYTTYDLTGFENIPIPGNASLFNNVANPYANGAIDGATGKTYASEGYYQGKTLPASYVEYEYRAGATTTNPNNRLGAFAVFNLLLSYTTPTPELPMVKHLKFDLNIQNLFDQHYYQYFYNQVTPASCPPTTFSGTGGGVLPQSAYSCVPSFNDGLPGEPFAVTFTVTARF
jgi:iron complex outermembrane receptor protein